AQLREVAEQRARVAAPEVELALQVLEDAAEAVPLRFVLPAVGLGQPLDQLRLHRREREVSRRHLVGRLISVSELDGVWNVRRISGALPPLLGVRKEISGTSGTTNLGPLPGARFDVVGLSLRYRAPFRGFVDELEAPGEVVRGRATFHGREFAR